MLKNISIKNIDPNNMKIIDNLKRLCYDIKQQMTKVSAFRSECSMTEIF